MEKVKYDQYMKEVVAQMSGKGVFLTAGSEKPNTMTIGWGSIGYYWGKPIFVVPVRKSRFTHHLIEEGGAFTVSIPFKDMSKALAFCGSKSGRDVDKYESMNLTLVPGKSVNVPIIGECQLHYECKVVYKQDMDATQLDPDKQDKWYSNHDYHTLYYGEIIACYIAK